MYGGDIGITENGKYYSVWGLYRNNETEEGSESLKGREGLFSPPLILGTLIPETKTNPQYAIVVSIFFSITIPI